MTHTDSQPVSMLLDGPVFADEFADSPQRLQQFRAEHDIDQRRLVPAKSAASGVHTIYFRPEHREWALVRLARRYRWVIEIQLLRGMSGERQLLRTGFTADDLRFLAEIVPEPPVQYSPVVYDVLWLAATTEAYVRLAQAIGGAEQFRPRDLLTRADGLSLDDASYLTRFLRSHLVRESVPRSSHTTRESNPESGELAIDLDRQYEVTPDGRASLSGIVEEYDRILERREFEPLLVDPGRDPESHLRGGAPDTTTATRASESQSTGRALSGDGGGTGADEPVAADDDAVLDAYTDAELAAAVDAARELIERENVARSELVKRATWDAVNRGERSKGDLWDAVSDALLASDDVNGRPGCRVWTARTFRPAE